MALFLSKSDFKIASTCPTKLYYKKLGFPTSDEGNEYMQYLAEGGYIVGKLATLLYPGGIEIDTGRDHEKAVDLTKQYLKEENIILFEAAVVSNGKLVRIDILEKKGNKINLIEVKSKSWNSEKPDLKDLKEYIEDVAFQYYVLKEAYPDFEVNPYLFLPDKSKRTSIDGLNLLFQIEEVKVVGKFKGYKISFDESRLQDLLKEDILTLVNVKVKVDEFLPEIKHRTALFLQSFKDGLAKIPEPLSKNCFSCEFSVIDEKFPVSGYDECWKEIPAPEHHVKDLYHVGTIGGYKNPLVNQLIKKRKVSLFDVSVDELSGTRGERQKIQIQYTKNKQEWINQDLKEELIKWEYPLHFIDFETCISAIPYHLGMRPYETIAFQWSCHTIQRPGAEPKHREWISLEPGFPNFKFAESLMNTVGTEGTFLMWATHENTVLKAIYFQMEEYGYSNPELLKWLKLVVKMDETDQGKFVDMNALAFKNYFHPFMKGRTSIKWTLPAVLIEPSSSRIKLWLDYFEDGMSLIQTDGVGFVDPYKLLPSIDLYEKADRIADGTGAMRAYEDLLIGVNRGNEDVKLKYAKALLRYCKLDTLAMVIIWEHWNYLLKTTGK